MKLSDTGELSQKQQTYIEGQLASLASECNTYWRYYIGQNPPIIDATAKLTPPDNRVPGPFARKLIDTLKGYAAKPGSTTYTTEGDYADTLKEIFDANDEELVTSEEFTDTCITGHGYEIIRVDEEAKAVKIYRIAPGTGYPVYDDTLAKNMIAFVHLVTITDEADAAVTTKIRTTYYADQWVEETSSGGAEFAETDRRDHPFGMVPAVDYTGSMDKLPLFYAVLALINEHDKITSSSYADDRDRFANAYLTMLKRIDNVKRDENGRTDLENIAIKRIFDGLGADGEIKDVASAIGFLAKPSRGSDVAEQADRFERLIYDFSSIINMNDYKAGTPTAAIAYRLKVMAMEFKAADFYAYFDKGLQRRIQIIDGAAAIHGGKPEPVTIHHERNIPSDIDTLAVTAGNLKGILSDETILNLFPGDIVPDKKEELKRLAGQMEPLPDDEAVSQRDIDNEETERNSENA